MKLNKHTPHLIVISAPSGTGKTTLCRRLLAENDKHFNFSISCTTRAPRGQEANGKDYYFISKPEFQKKIANNEFAEWAEVHDQYYGTLKSTIEESFKNNRSVLLDIDVQGAAQLRKVYPEKSLLLFIAPPNLVELEKRLRGRGTDAEDKIQKRLKNAESEMKQISHFDAVVVNHDLDVAYKEFLGHILKKIS